ncbi:LytTR family DNA-binding domain-containing protein [Neolewinella agarilytica]|uniref:Transcriptional regulator, LytTR family n=1 Tax=Neolewinella agarilytica TaxID=478744 RepID=A0A1H9FTC9_9BACT|nr:LytTR family DNA-binding domain-containing protein [Neolewinella agarilytica]SEQ41191.1 transcriptional regulator, LytTR family [Neolewinella agarilytica]
MKLLDNNPLKRPFPDRDFDRSSILGMFWVGLFVFAVLFFLQPYGMHAEGNFFLTCLGYGLVTFLVGSAYLFVTSEVLGWKKFGDGWTLGKWVLDCGLLLAFISVGNFIFYNFTVNWTAFDPLILATITVPTVIIGLFPIAFSGMAIQLRAERENQRVAGEVQLARLEGGKTFVPSRLVSLAEGGVMIDPANLLFCESRQNYVRCVFLKEGVVAEETILGTLSGLEEKIGEPLSRCHRSYLVNLLHVRQARGNAQGLKLELVGTTEEVPVSRAYVGVIRERVMG